MTVRHPFLDVFFSFSDLQEHAPTLSVRPRSAQKDGDERVSTKDKDNNNRKAFDQRRLVRICPSHCQIPVVLSPEVSNFVEVWRFPWSVSTNATSPFADLTRTVDFFPFQTTPYFALVVLVHAHGLTLTLHHWFFSKTYSNTPQVSSSCMKLRKSVTTRRVCKGVATKSSCFVWYSSLVLLCPCTIHGDFS